MIRINKVKLSLSNLFLLIVLMLLYSCDTRQPKTESGTKGEKLRELNTKLAKGWNTWNTRSVLSHVLLPECFAVNIQIENRNTRQLLEEAIIGRQSWKGELVEKIKPGPHAYDGSYTSLELSWSDIKIRIQSASLNNELYLLITPQDTIFNANIRIMPEMLWGKNGFIKRERYGYFVQTNDSSFPVFISGIDSSLSDSSEFISIELNGQIAMTTGTLKDIYQIKKIIQSSEIDFEKSKFPDTNLTNAYNAFQRVLAWDIIYEPVNNRVIAPVSRWWSMDWGGWVLFEWDTFFAAYMLSFDNKDLAYSNVLALTNEIAPNGFIPNYSSGIGKSDDRSQPPVGSVMVKEIYKNHREKWFLEEVFDELLSWNRWWDKYRNVNGYLCFGTNSDTSTQSIRTIFTDIEVQPSGKYSPEEMRNGKWEYDKLKQSRFEGLDNSPMYDDVSFDTVHHVMLLADVGLMSLYIADCKALTEIAGELQKTDIVKELEERAVFYTKSLQTLWDDKSGMFLNRNLKTNDPSYRLSPTLFYPLLAKAATPSQAERMIKEHFFNTDEFYGEFIIPSIARNDVAFKDQFYWRGRIWAPMNFLVYLGLRNYSQDTAREVLVEKSTQLIMKSWLNEGAIYENFNAETGQGSDVLTSDRFYHWGALLSYMIFIENGSIIAPEATINSTN